MLAESRGSPRPTDRHRCPQVVSYNHSWTFSLFRSRLTTSAEAEIRRRISECGPIPFAEFMEVALYWPGGGYYSASRGPEGSPFGSGGDYYTSPMAHPAFGALLAVQLYQFWLLLDRPSPFWVVEPGSGNGQLCRDILWAAASLPDGFQESLSYLCMDRSYGTALPSTPQARHITTAGAPLRNVRGCIISNELLDAFPVHQVKVEQGRLREVYVGLERDGQSGEARLVERLDDPRTPALEARLAELDVRLAEGQTAEINLGMEAWYAAIASALDTGFVLTVDYGRRAEELYSAEQRRRGTLVTYHRHTQTDAPLRNVGQQDITAQVDFSSAVNAGRRAGLNLLGYTTQAGFLRNLGFDYLRRRITSTPMPVGQATANRAGLMALTRGDGLGDFKVLAQGKGLGSGAGGKPELWGFTRGEEAPGLARTVSLPLLSPDHIALPQGWPQPAVQEFVLDDLMAGPFGDT